ncbi:hypothetical protein EYC84_000021 [Monilinia fructicola]|uniref:Beta-galactosidase n=1 Tax=Monilinia fructicola TaxID=38448 RepID=A0A5M9JS46_MONFR|nr:hypothetical protein EYC84_000021 [Monilinia fructicola]
MRFLRAFTAITCAAQAAALTINLGGEKLTVERDEGLQDVVTYDEHSLKVYGERLFIFSGEFHPYRLPVPDLWIDIFQKIKSLGFNTVSFYVHWALVEGNPGHTTLQMESLLLNLSLMQPKKRYINAEAAGGGFPGWIQRIKGVLRSQAPDYLAATDNYIANIAGLIAKYEITKGGPIILYQPENEYSGYAGYVPGGFPDPVYFAYVKKQARDAGVTVPFISNDAWAQGLFAPGDEVNGSTIGNVDIYGHDSYPLGFDCAHPTTWPGSNLPTYFAATHKDQSPSTFYSLNEFQGGAFDPWGGLGFQACAQLLNEQFERVFYKNDFASGVTLLNLYMLYGGTNWGNLGHSGGYTSYDYGSAITENRELTREKYSELKLEANFLKVSPAYLTATVKSAVIGTYTNSSTLITTPLFGNGTATNFYVVRHADYQTLSLANYKLNLKTSQGDLTIPQLKGSLTLSEFDDKTALVVYGGPNEAHELAVVTKSSAQIVEGSGITTKSTNGSTILNWETSATRRVVKVGSVFVYILDRNSAFIWQTLLEPTNGYLPGLSQTKTPPTTSFSTRSSPPPSSTAQTTDTAPGSFIFRGHFTASRQRILPLPLHARWLCLWLLHLAQLHYISAPGAAPTTPNRTTALTPCPTSKPAQNTSSPILIDNKQLDSTKTGSSRRRGNEIAPRILNYVLAGRPKDAITWNSRATSAREQYIDQVRGPSTKAVSTPSDKASRNPTPKHRLRMGIQHTAKPESRARASDL